MCTLPHFPPTKTVKHCDLCKDEVNHVEYTVTHYSRNAPTSDAFCVNAIRISPYCAHPPPDGDGNFPNAPPLPPPPSVGGASDPFATRRRRGSTRNRGKRSGRDEAAGGAGAAGGGGGGGGGGGAVPPMKRFDVIDDEDDVRPMMGVEPEEDGQINAIRPCRNAEGNPNE